MKSTAIFFYLLFPMLVMASEQAGHGAHGLDAHQIKVIIYQTINVTIMLAGIIYFAKKPIQKMLADKKQAFVKAAEHAEEAKKKAETELYEMKIKLSKLEATAEESVMRARAEAADLKKQIIDESVAISARIKSDAETTARLEIEKAKKQLREEMIAQATQIARAKMSSDVSVGEQQKLKDDFIQHLGGN